MIYVDWRKPKWDEWLFGIERCMSRPGIMMKDYVELIWRRGMDDKEAKAELDKLYPAKRSIRLHIGPMFWEFGTHSKADRSKWPKPDDVR